MRTLVRLSLITGLLTLGALSAQAGGAQPAGTRAAIPAQLQHSLRIAAAPFQAIGWALYHFVRAPGQVAELVAFGETGEQLVQPIRIAPRAPWETTRREHRLVRNTHRTAAQPATLSQADRNGRDSRLPRRKPNHLRGTRIDCT